MFLGHQTNFNKFGGPKNSQGIFSDHNGSIVDINNRKELGKWQIFEIKQILPNSPWGKWKFIREIRKCFELNEDENNKLKFVGYK